jgi:hypothetical protein
MRFLLKLRCKKGNKDNQNFKFELRDGTLDEEKQRLLDNVVVPLHNLSGERAPAASVAFYTVEEVNGEEMDFCMGVTGVVEGMLAVRDGATLSERFAGANDE